MKRAQVSVEFVVLFGVALFIFMLFISLIPGWIDQSRSSEHAADRLAREFKQKLIVASLARQDYETTFVMPVRVENAPISFELYGGTDNLLVIKANDDSGRILARSFLPSFALEGTSGNDLKIVKMGDSLRVIRSG